MPYRLHGLCHTREARGCCVKTLLTLMICLCGSTMSRVLHDAATRQKEGANVGIVVRRSAPTQTPFGEPDTFSVSER